MMDMELHYFDTLPSTSKTAAEAAAAGAGHLYTVVASTQSAGRGRLQRSFYSPRGGLYFSTVLRTKLTPAAYGAITPYAALAVHRAILRVCGVYTEIKWVNDLLLNGKKLCGILAESGVDRAGVPYVILGIGINTGSEEMPEELRDIACSIPVANTNALLHAVLGELAEVEHALQEGNWIDAYRAASAVLGREVNVIKNGEKRLAFAEDILPSGALLVRYANAEREELCVGEISLRLTQ